MAAPLLGVSFLFALGNWLAVGLKRIRLEYFTKPGTLLFLIIWFVSATGLRPGAVWFALGLLFSLFGDIFLMIPRNLFLAGLGSFLLAQISYVAGFNQSAFPATAGMLAVTLIVGVIAVAVFRRLKTGLNRRPDGRKLLPGVLVYSLALTLMLLSALSTLFRPEWSLLPAVIAAWGGALFYTSDSVLAYDRFVRPLSNGHLWVMITYHLGQFGLMSGVVLHLLRDL